MTRTVAIGIQDFGDLIRKKCFYIDKTSFIKEWWENADTVTLITRPRRFGKTLTMSMVEQFFSVSFAEDREIFSGLAVWEDEKYRKLQGTYPVISLSFADIKETSFDETKKKICYLLKILYNKYDFLLDCDVLNESEKEEFRKSQSEIDDYRATVSLRTLADYLSRYYGKKVIILLDEYDTPMQEAYVHGFWEELVSFTRSFFNSTFKTNPFLERAVMTGITRVSTPKASLGKESIFSDLNNLKVVTTTSDEYASSFGFTEKEVFSALDEYGIEQKAEVKRWYDGFTFGQVKDMYNPWSIINFLDTGKTAAYWANTSSNSLVGKLLREGNSGLKEQFETLLRGGTIQSDLDEQIVYNQLDEDEEAIWSLLLASGYLRVVRVEDEMYELALTNYEVERMFRRMVKGWFKKSGSNYNDFVKALLLGDKKAMNAYMNRVALNTISYFDTGRRPSGQEPERFYHGLVLGLLVELSGRYVLTSNRESGFGRYDVLLEPLNREDDGIILEFKVFDPEDEKDLADTVAAALAQIEERQYERELIRRGIPAERIRKYGFAFEGKKVRIG